MRKVGLDPSFVEKSSIESPQVLNTPTDSPPVPGVSTSNKLEVSPRDILPVTDLVLAQFSANLQLGDGIVDEPGTGLQVAGFPHQAPTLLR